MLHVTIDDVPLFDIIFEITDDISQKNANKNNSYYVSHTNSEADSAL